MSHKSLFYRNYWVKTVGCYTGDGSTLLSSVGFIIVYKTCSKWTSEQRLCLHPKAVKVLWSCFSLSCRNSNCRSRRAKPWPPTKTQGNLNKQNTGNEARGKTSVQRDSWADSRHSSKRNCSLTSQRALFHELHMRTRLWANTTVSYSIKHLTEGS